MSSSSVIGESKEETQDGELGGSQGKVPQGDALFKVFSFQEASSAAEAGSEDAAYNSE